MLRFGTFSKCEHKLCCIVISLARSYSCKGIIFLKEVVNLMLVVKVVKFKRDDTKNEDSISGKINGR